MGSENISFDTKASPIVSIIMPCFNGELTLSAAIKTVLEQDFIDLELIIIDDYSTDNSAWIINDWAEKDSRVISLVNDSARGVWQARNIGLKHVKGKYIAFLDCDDYLLPSSISLRVKALEMHGCGLVYGPYLRLHPDGKFSYRSAKETINFRSMLKTNQIGNLTGMYDSSTFGIMFQQCIGAEDYLMWCSLVRIFGFACSTGKEPLAVYRVSCNSLSGDKFRAFKWHWHVLRIGLHIKSVPACFYQLNFMMGALFYRFIEKLLFKWRSK